MLNGVIYKGYFLSDNCNCDLEAVTILMALHEIRRSTDVIYSSPPVGTSHLSAIALVSNRVPPSALYVLVIIRGELLCRFGQVAISGRPGQIPVTSLLMTSQYGGPSLWPIDVFRGSAVTGCFAPSALEARVTMQMVVQSPPVIVIMERPDATRCSPWKERIGMPDTSLTERSCELRGGGRQKRILRRRHVWPSGVFIGFVQTDRSCSQNSGFSSARRNCCVG